MEGSRVLVAASLVIAGIGAISAGWLLAHSAADVVDRSEEIARHLSVLELPTLEGEVAGPKHSQGPVVLDFWASWCSPCHVQSRLLGELAEAYAGRVQFFAINVGESADIVRESLSENPIEFQVLLDLDGQAGVDADVYGLPTLIVLSPEGEIVLRREGLTPNSIVKRTLDELLDGRRA